MSTTGPTPQAHAPAGSSTPELFNREVSWLRFNDRVLEEALDPRNPLLERLRFLTIFYTNLDEFFMIRVSGLKQQIQSGVDVLSADGLSPRAQLARVVDQLGEVLPVAQRCLQDDILPALKAYGVHILHYADLDAKERKHWDRWYLDQVHPVLTPLAVGPTHPFPFISNLSLNVALQVTSPITGESRLARVKVPPYLPRLVPLDGDLDHPEPPVRLLPLEELIGANLHTLFPGMKVGRRWLFRVIRDADVEIREDEANDLLTVLQEELRKRRFGRVVHLAVEKDMPTKIRTALRVNLELEPDSVTEVPGMLGASDLSALVDFDLPELKYKPFVPRVPEVLHNEDVFAAIRSGDVLLHHPFDAFSPVTEFIQAAASDPQVRAIKQTLYRTSGDSRIVAALLEAAENGKQVAAIVELKARFDEENNIVWARRLEEAGVHVIYGVPGLKTHAKMAMVVREEAGKLRRYAHLGTGNYNASTARVYTDLGLLTCDKKICADVADLFNRLTGFSQPAAWRRLLVAPTHMLDRLVALIGHEADEARAGRPARIILKCNAVTEPTVIEALYAASRVGVKVDLIVRGICALVPGVANQSETIQVRSVVGRFLEHSRVYWFNNGGDPAVYMGSADLMPRNLTRRVEILAPLQTEACKAWIRDVFLERYLNDEGRTRVMNPDGTYTRLEGERDVHQEFLKDR